MDETFFYIAGGVLVALALIVSAIGMRSEKFPTNGQLWIGVVLVAVVVVLTSAGAVVSSQEEAEHREAENAEAAEAQAEETAENEEEAGGGSASAAEAEPEEEQSGTGDDPASGSDVSGAEVFVSEGCGSCHSLADDPTATGSVGPNLDEALDQQTTEYIRISIIAPDEDIAEGFSAEIMPETYGEDLSEDEIDALVEYLAQATSK